MWGALPPAVRLGELSSRSRAAGIRAPVRSKERPTVVRLWLPLTVVFLLLAPFALLLTPFLYFVPRPRRLSPLATVLAVGAFLLSLGGTDVDVRTHDATVRLKIV